MSSLERVVIVPWNGYVNRLQALASASILAEHFRARLQVSWEPEPIAPAQAGELFDDSFVVRDCVPTHHVTEILGRPHHAMPRYLTIESTRRVAFLAGHDQGEQVFMPALERLVRSDPEVRTLVMVAGGKFHLPSEVDFTVKRQHFYSKIDWHPDIGSRAKHLISTHQPYIGLHIRSTDRSREAPRAAIVERALEELAAESGLSNVFLAADSEAGLMEWNRRTSALGLRTWTSEVGSFDRHNPVAGQQAIVDWQVLSAAQGIVYSASSSFGQEAAIMNANPDWSHAIQASPGVRILRDVRRFSRSATGKIKRGLTNQP